MQTSLAIFKILVRQILETKNLISLTMILTGSCFIVNDPMQCNLHCIRPNNLVNATPHSMTGLEETAPPQAERTPTVQSSPLPQ